MKGMGRMMADNVMFIPACVLMVVELAAVIFLVKEWIKAKKGDGEDGK